MKLQRMYMYVLKYPFNFSLIIEGREIRVFISKIVFKFPLTGVYASIQCEFYIFPEYSIMSSAVF